MLPLTILTSLYSKQWHQLKITIIKTTSRLIVIYSNTEGQSCKYKHETSAFLPCHLSLFIVSHSIYAAVRLACDFQFHFLRERERELKLREMVIGTMEVTLMDARGLSNSDFFNKIDPYVLIQYEGQEHKSSTATGQGRNPKWNEKFTFRVEYPGADQQPKLVLKIMDHDTFSSDDFIGQASIYLKEVLELGVENGTAELRAHKYSVVDSNQSYTRDIRVGITFTPKVEAEIDAQEFGGWKESQW